MIHWQNMNKKRIADAKLTINGKQAKEKSIFRIKTTKKFCTLFYLCYICISLIKLT